MGASVALRNSGDPTRPSRVPNSYLSGASMSAQRAQRIRNGVVSANPAFGDTCVQVRSAGARGGSVRACPAHAARACARWGAWRSRASRGGMNVLAGGWADLAGAAGRRTVDEDRDGRHARRRQRRRVDARPRVRLRHTRLRLRLLAVVPRAVQSAAAQCGSAPINACASRCGTPCTAPHSTTGFTRQHGGLQGLPRACVAVTATR